MFSVSFFFRSNSLILPQPHRSLTDQAATIASGLKTPSLPIWSRHHRRSEVAIATSVWSCHAASIWTHLSHDLKLQHRLSDAHLSYATDLKLADLKLCRPPQLSPSLVGCVWSLIVVLGWGFVVDFEIFFFFLFCWGFWIWNLLEDPVIVVVLCGGGCSGSCWFLGGGDCHWAVHLCWLGFE